MQRGGLMNQIEFEEKIYRQSDMEWAFIDMGWTWIDDIKAGRLTIADIPKKQNIPKTKKKKTLSKVRGRARELIDSKLKISEVAIKYGIKLEKNNKIICPFHDDTDPSLSLNDDINVFFCFGCHATGDIINFIGRLEDGKKRSNK